MKNNYFETRFIIICYAHVLACFNCELSNCAIREGVVMRVDPRTATMTSECKSGPSPVAAGGSSDVGEPVDPPD